jgi:senataxin
MHAFNCEWEDVNINSVDAYQGQEKDIIIFNCVRANHFRNAPISAQLGFLTDLRRLNVAITRPKHFLFIVGNSDTLSLSKVWTDMIESYKHSYCSYVEVPFTNIFSPELIKTCLNDLQATYQ